jgi:hypothetical protein
VVGRDGFGALDERGDPGGEFGPRRAGEGVAKALDDHEFGAGDGRPPPARPPLTSNMGSSAPWIKQRRCLCGRLCTVGDGDALGRPVTRRRWGGRGVVVVSIAALAGLGLLVWVAFLPVLANHFGYALPGKNGLPYRVHYDGRDYRSHLTCAGADWCEAEKTAEDRARPFCTPRAELRVGMENRDESLVEVDEVVTLFGPSHAVFVIRNNATGQAAMAILVEAAADCYVSYTLMGGP